MADAAASAGRATPPRRSSLGRPECRNQHPRRLTGDGAQAADHRSPRRRATARPATGPAGGTVGFVPTMGYAPRRPWLADAGRQGRWCRHRRRGRGRRRSPRRGQHLRQPPPVRRRPRTSGSYPRDLDRDRRAGRRQRGRRDAGAPPVEEMYPFGPVLTSVSVAELSTALGGGLPPDPLRRRRHRRVQAVQHHRPVPGLLRGEGLPAAGGHPPDGGRPVGPDRGRRLPHHPRAGRAGHVEPQRLPLARGPGRGRGPPPGDRGRPAAGGRWPRTGTRRSVTAAMSGTSSRPGNPGPSLDYAAAVDPDSLAVPERIGTRGPAPHRRPTWARTRLIDNACQRRPVNRPRATEPLR